MWQVCSTEGEKGRFQTGEKTTFTQNLLQHGLCVTMEGFTTNWRRLERKTGLKQVTGDQC